jgi:glycine betaine/proline transport system substrate-binding protein
MKLIPSGWKRYPVLLALLIAFPLLVAACGGDEEKPVIKFADNQFGGSLHILTGVAMFVTEHGYGYTPEMIEMTTPVGQVTLANGESHVWMEGWQQNMMEWYEEELAAGNIANMGNMFEGGPQFFVIPKWVQEQHGINTVEDLKANWELFKDPEDPSKGAFYNCIIGWQCAEINAVKLGAYGLAENFNNISPGSAAALKAVLVGAQIKEEPVVGYYWAPTDVMGLYDWHILEEPAYTEACWDVVTAAAQDPTLRPVGEACAYEVVPIDALVWGGLEDMAPDLWLFLKKMNAGLAPLSDVLGWAESNEVTDLLGDGALYFINSNKSLVQSWVTSDAWEKIVEALDEAS